MENKPRIFWIRYPSDYRADHLITDEEYHEDWRDEDINKGWIKVVEVIEPGLKPDEKED